MADLVNLSAKKTTNTKEKKLEIKQKKNKEKVQYLEPLNFFNDENDFLEEVDNEAELNELISLIDDFALEKESGSDESKKRKKDAEENNDTLEADGYDQLEEKLKAKVNNNKRRRLKTTNCEEIDIEICAQDKNYEEEDLKDEEVDMNCFIVDSNGTRIPANIKNKRTPIYKNATIRKSSPTRRRRFTDAYNKIVKTDIPERMQLRNVPITAVPKESNELNEEANWIYRRTYPNLGWASNPIPKICKVLDFLRNEHLEVPFIAFYRKEDIQPELKINDLWQIYKFDQKWCLLKQYKEYLLFIIKSLRAEKDLQKTPITENESAIKDSDIAFLESVETFEEFKDFNERVFFYHRQDLKNWKAKQIERIRIEKREKGIRENENEEEGTASVKRVGGHDFYTTSKICGLNDLANKFGLTTQQFAENFRDNYRRHEVKQEACTVEKIARRYVCSKFPTESDVLHAAEVLVALQISKEPLIKRSLRVVFFNRATITVVPTEYGDKKIDENHDCYSMKCLKNKPVIHLTGEEFLKLNLAQKENLLTVTINDTIKGYIRDSMVQEFKRLYVRHEFGKNVQDWNTLRGKCIERAFKKYIFPSLKNELANILLEDAKESILRSCRKKLYDWLKVAPYRAQFSNQDVECKNGLRVMAIAYDSVSDKSPFVCTVAPHGVVTEYLELPYLLKTHKNYKEQRKETIFKTLSNFISMQKPHLIVIGGECREALMILRDIRYVISKLIHLIGFPSIKVEIIDNEFAKVYANSNQGKSDFPEFPELLIQAISLARKMQDPLIEYAQLWNHDNEILNLEYHPLQKQIPKEELLQNLRLEFIYRTNEVGVDINRAIEYPRTSKLLQFVCGLGPRKAENLLRTIEQTNKKLENRGQLLTLYDMNLKVYVNCSGFIKICTKSLDKNVQPLDRSRIHPESYHWATKIAEDILADCNDDDDEGLNPIEVVVKIFDTPGKFCELDLDLYASDMELSGYGYKLETLYGIREEFYSPYKDLRSPYVSPNSEEMFLMLAKLKPNTLYVGKLITGKVSELIYTKPNPYPPQSLVPTRNTRNNLWSCPICKYDRFRALEDIWHHFDTEKCPGKATAVKLVLDYGMFGYIDISNWRDSVITNLRGCVSIGEIIMCRILHIDKASFSVYCTSKFSDLIDENNKFIPRKDPYYDYQYKENDKIKREIYNNNGPEFPYYRVCVHPYFKNLSFREAEQYLAIMLPGQIIIRPSSTRSNYLIVTWKVADHIYQHIDVLEEDKINAYTIGSTLQIDGQTFKNLDDIIMLHVHPMMTFTYHLLLFKYYKKTNGGTTHEMEAILNEEARKDSSKMHYFITASRYYSGKFLLSYFLNDEGKHEYITITSKGYRFRQRLFWTVDLLFNWFKQHFNDATPDVVTLPTTHSVKKVTSSSAHSASFQKTTKDLSNTKKKTLSEITNQTHSNSPSTSSSHNTPNSGRRLSAPSFTTLSIPYNLRSRTHNETSSLQSPGSSPHAVQTGRTKLKNKDKKKNC